MIKIKANKYLIIALLLVFTSINSFALCTDTGSGVFVCDNSTGYEQDPADISGVSLEKKGSAETELSGANTITSAVDINGGVLTISSQSNLAGDYRLNINSAQLKTKGDVSLENNTIYLDNAVVNTQSGVLSFNGTVLGGALTKTGEGTLELNNGNLFTGNINLSQGALDTSARSAAGNVAVSANAALTFDDSSDVAYSSSIIGGGTFYKKGAGALVLNGSNSVSKTVISQGSIFLSSPNNLSGDIELDGGFIASGDSLILNNNIKAGGGGFDVDYSGGEDDEGLTLTGNLTGDSFDKKGTGFLIIDTANRYEGDINIIEGGVITDAGKFGGNVQISDGEENFFALSQETDGVYAGSVSGGGDFIKDGSAKLTLTGQNTVASVIIFDGALSISADDNISGDITIDGGELMAEGDVTLGGAQKQKIIFENDIASIQKSLNVSSGAALTFGQNLVLEGYGGIVKDGGGKLVLNHDFSQGNYYGDTLIQDGSVEIFDGEALGNYGSTVMIRDAELLISATTSLNREIAAQLGYNSVLNIAQSKEVLVNQNLRGYGAFVKEGDGVLTMGSGQMVHTGGTFINAGTVQGNSENLAGNITNDAGLNFLQDKDGTFLGTLFGAGATNKYGAGTLSLTGTHNFSGVYNIYEGALKGNSGNLTSDIITRDDTSIIFKQDFDGEYASNISGSGDLLKEGNAILKLTGLNSHTGNTIIKDENGILFEDDAALGSAASKIILEGGNISLEENITQTSARGFVLGTGPNYITALENAQFTIEGNLSGTSFVKLGKGKLILKGANTHSGGTQISEGVLSVSDTSSLGSGMLAVTGGTFNTTADMALASNVYISGIAGFDIESGTTLKTTGFLYGGGTINKKGAGTLELGEYNHYTGGLDIEEGKVTGHADSILGDIKMSGASVLDFVQDYGGFYVGDISAQSGTVINKFGEGMLIMQGDKNGTNKHNVGTFNINEGSVIALSMLNGNINIARGAALNISQHSAGDINVNGELYADPELLINIEGDVHVNDGGSLILSAVQGKTNLLKIKDDGSSSKGHLNLHANSTLGIMAEGVFGSPESFKILAYDGNLNGVFGSASVLNSKRLTAEIDYTDPNYISVLITRMLSNYAGISGLNNSQRQFAFALDRASAAPGADFESVLDILDNLSLETQAAALTQAGGFIYANIHNLNSFNMMRSNAYLRIDNQKEGELINNIWVQSVSNYSDMKENNDSAKLYNFSSGFVLGLDKYYQDKDLRAGLAASYTRHDLKHNSTENLDGDEYHLGAYLLARRSVFDLKSSLSLGYRNSAVTRSISFAGREAQSNVKAVNLNFDIEASAKITDIGSFELRPFAGAAASAEKRNSFKEKNAGDINLSFSGDFIFYGDIRAGLGLQKNAKSFSYYADAVFKQPLIRPDTELNIYSQKYTIKAADKKSTYGLRLGAVKTFSELISIFADGGADINSEVKNIYFNLGLRSYW